MTVQHRVDSIREHNAEISADEDRKESLEDLLSATAELGDMVAELMDGVAELGDLIASN